MTVPELVALGCRDHVTMARPMAECGVSAFADGLDRVVGERGVMLSGGQKQRGHRPRLSEEPADPDPGRGDSAMPMTSKGTWAALAA